MTPPRLDPDEDWIRLPADERNVAARLERLAALRDRRQHRARLLDMALHHGGPCPPPDDDVVLLRVLIARLGELVTGDDLVAALGPGAGTGPGLAVTRVIAPRRERAGLRRPMDGTREGVTGRPSRRRWLLAAVALFVVATLVAFDCVNFLRSDSWTDLSRAPHQAALHQGTATAGDPGVEHTAHPVPAVVPAAVALLAVWLPWGIASQLAPTRRAAGVRRRHAGRSPPTPAVRLAARS